MNFNIGEAIELLERTPRTLESWLSGLSAGWLTCSEGEGTWNAAEVVAHLAEAERTNWVPRLESMLRGGEASPLPPFDRFAHLRSGAGRPVGELLSEFSSLRAASVARLRRLDVDGGDDSGSGGNDAGTGAGGALDRTGIHPEFGEVTVRELLSTWVVHDLTHIAQIARVMAERYRADVGPWQAYLGVLKKNGA